MSGARARKLDLSGFLAGNSRTASIIANTDQSGGIGGLLSGIAGGISRAGANIREDKQRGEEKAYRAGRDKFNDRLALRADKRAEADQSIQEDEYKRKVASEARSVEETTHLLSRAQVAGQTGMPMDPKVLEGIQKHATVIQAAGGVTGIMAKAAQLEEPDVEGLIAQTAKYESLGALLTQQMGREKNPARHAALGDAFMQLSSIVSANKYRLRLHEANTKNRAEIAETRAKAEAEAAVKNQEEKADLDAFNADLVANGQEPVSSLEYGKMRERERGIDERTRENNELREKLKTKDQEIAVARDTAVKEDRAAARMVREQQAAETERHNRATEQLRAVGTNNPNKDRMKALEQKAKLHLANAKQYGDYDSAVGDTTKAREEMAQAKAALDSLDTLMRESGGAGTAPPSDDDYPGVGDREKWRALTPEQKQAALKRMGR